MPIMDELSTPLTNCAVAGVQNLGTSIRYDIPLASVNQFAYEGYKLTPAGGAAYATDPEFSNYVDAAGTQSGLTQYAGNFEQNFTQTTNSLQSGATNAGSAVTNGASAIGNNSVFSAEGFKNLGNGLKGGLATSIGGMVGGLVQNVPFVGGLFSG